MGESSDKVGVYLEAGKKRVFAGALDWPGWCRSGRDEGSALQALLESGKRYGQALQAVQVKFHAPGNLSSLVVAERLAGTPTTDFGAPEVPPSVDSNPVDSVELNRLSTVLEACWHAFDAAVMAATGRELRKGPRGGGRDVAGIIQHVLGADSAYLSRLGWKHRSSESLDPADALSQIRQATLQALAAAAGNQLPASGPRGGVHWTPRYFVRRAAWHILDHAWEIEDRIQ